MQPIGAATDLSRKGQRRAQSGIGEERFNGTALLNELVSTGKVSKHAVRRNFWPYTAALAVSWSAAATVTE
ncbi:MAG TPA: hypothetical protein VGH51_09370 [Candidatus Angelobacter sp.]|jgi:hypothetical protein